MPAGPLELHCQQSLEDIVTISQRIRSSALRCANNQENYQYLNIIESLRQQLETIRRSAETILEAITLQNCIIDGQIITWLFSGGLPPCLDKLKEVDDVFKLDGLEVRPAATPALPPRLAADNITRAMVLFEKHKDIFYFLLTPEVWNRERHLHQSLQVPQSDTLPPTEETPQDAQENTARRSSTEREYGHGEDVSQSNADQETTRQKELIHQKLDEVSRWLAALECTDKHNETLKQRQQGTCTWFPNTGAYKVWRSGSSPFLWLHGRGGCGKSVMVASTIEHLKSTLEDGDVLVYYYCDFRNERSMNPTEVMRSLLSQLFRHFRDCGVDAGALPNRILEEKSDGTLMFNDLDQIAHLVLRAASRFPREPMILIDALDECAEVEKFLPALATLIHSHIRLLVTSRPLEIFQDHFRKYPSLSLHAMGKELAADIGLHITQELYSHAQLRSVDAKLKYQVRMKLREKADGRFRWVQCQLDTLKQCSSKQELQKVLDDLPGELEATYERILSKIDERRSEAKLVRRALTWLIAALVPLRLAQLLDGLSFDPQQRRIHYGTQSLGPALVDALSSLVSYNKETDVLALSHLTVKEYLTSRTALPMYRIISHEAHVEVTKMCMFYITSLLKQVRFRASLTISESSPMLSYVFSTGLNHLAHVDPASSVILEVLQSFALEIHHHPSHWDILCELREEDPRRFYPPWPSSRHDLVLYILIAYSSVGLLESFLSLSCPLKPRPGTNPLVYASDLWKTTHAITLLGSGVDVTVPGLVVDDSRHALPLEIAVDQGNDALVGELLQKGSVVTSELLLTAVCMPWCSTRVLIKLVQTDAFMEWAHEIRDEEMYRAIFNSARPNAGDNSQTDRDHVALARRLHEVGRNLAPVSLFGAELVERALHAAHISMLEYLLPPDQPPPARFLIAACTGNTSETASVVRFLLQRGINVHVVSRGRKDTALHLAAMSPWEPHALELTKLLLDAGCDPGARNRRRETPLTIAVRRGYLTVVEHLLSRKAPLPSHILLFALQKRRELRMVQLLIGAGVNIDACTSTGNKGLHLAVMYMYEVKYEELQDEERVVEQVVHEAWQDNEHEEDNEFVDNDAEEDWYEDEDDIYEDEDDIYGPCEEYREVERLELVKLLIEAGSDLDSCGAEGKTVMENAMEHGYTSVVEYLLSCDVPLPPDILPTAMLHGCHPQLVERLAREGANVQCTASDGETVLHLAIIWYNESLCLDLVKIFIEAGCSPTSQAQGGTVLEYAILCGHTSVVEHLLSYGVPLPPDILPTAMLHGCPPQLVERLAREGANVQCTASDGETVLHLAITWYNESPCLNLVKIFIEAGCDPTSQALGRTVLELAISRGHTSVVECLLTIGVSLPPDLLSTVLQRRMIGNSEMAALLVRKGADVHFTTNDGDTVLHLTTIHYKGSLCIDLIKIFIEAGCDPTSYGAQGRTVLELAITVGFASVLDDLLSLGFLLPPASILPTATLEHEWTPQFIGRLIGKNADIDCPMSKEAIELDLAIGQHERSSYLDLVKIFIEAGCDPSSCIAQGRTVLEVSIAHEYDRLVDHLLSCVVQLPPDILPTVLQRRLVCKSDTVALLVRKGADVHSTTSSGDTVLHLAIILYKESSCLELVKIFVEAGCDPVSYGAGARTALRLAVEHRYTSVVNHLLSSCNLHPGNLPPALLHHDVFEMIDHLVESLSRKGRDVHFAMSNGDTTLHLVITIYGESMCLELVKIFIEAGCDPTSHGVEGSTVLELAISRGYTSVVEFLLITCDVPCPPGILPTALRLGSTLEIIGSLVRKGADVHSTSSGETALHVVIATYCESTSLELVKIFVEAGCDPKRCNSEGKSVWIAIMERGYGSVLELLFSYNIPCPPDVLLMALQYRLASRTIDFLIRNGANAKLTTVMGDTALHLIVAGYSECTSPDLVRRVVEAGCNPNTCNSKGKSVLMAAIEKGYTSVVELLLSYNVLIPPDILPTVLQLRTTPRMTESLTLHGADAHFATSSGGTLLQIAHASHVEPARQLIVDIIDPARRTKRAGVSLEDGAAVHVPKRPRLG